MHVAEEQSNGWKVTIVFVEHFHLTAVNKALEKEVGEVSE